MVTPTDNACNATVNKERVAVTNGNLIIIEIITNIPRVFNTKETAIIFWRSAKKEHK